MSKDEIVIINDDKERDSDIEVIDISKENSAELKSSNDNTIIIDDDDVIEIIDIDRDTNDQNVKDYLSKVCFENRIVGEFIEKCLDLENSSGMLRVIHRTFLPLYFKMDDAYRESDDFKKILDKSMRALEVSPNRKFSHLKSVCEVMKGFHKGRKKVSFITLSTQVKAKPSQQKPRKRKRLASKNKVYKKVKRKSKMIDDHNESPAVLNKDTDVLAESLIETEVVVLEDDIDLPNNSNKENDDQSASNKISTHESNSEVNTSNQLLLLLPQKSEEFIMNERKAMRITYIEKVIEHLKKKIDDLEQQEVDWDSLVSPYLTCEELKSRIVNLYKELCTLTGSEAVKKREVRFTATEGRPHLPVKILEELINENIGSDGNPHFPDFAEVVKCVSKANEDAKLGWPQTQILAEARNLFTYCGQALQKNRKKREWRYLLSRVDTNVDDDPAEKDPVLKQRLEQNRRIAVKKECDLLDKYVKMEQYGTVTSQKIPSQLAQGAYDEDIDEPVPQVTNTTTEITTTSNHNFNILATKNHEKDNDQTCTNTSTTKVTVYGSHRSKTNNQTHEKDLPQESNKITKPVKYITILVPAMENEKRVECETKYALHLPISDNKQNDKSMIETYVKNNTAPEVTVIDVPSSLPLENDEENRIETGINDERTELDLAGNVTMNDSTPAPESIVIKDVYSIAMKQEIIQNNNYDLDKSDIVDDALKGVNIQVTSKISTEECENTDVKKVTPVTTAKINESTNYLHEDKLEVLNNNSIPTIKLEFSDVFKDMEIFGDSFTATIFDVEDPFLVIEISDSSDDSDGDGNL